MFNVPSFMGFDKAGFGTPIDPDAAAFFARVTAAGGTLSATEQTAVNTLVVQMKADGIWTAMKAIYPMVGASAAACAQNLKSSSFTGTFQAVGHLRVRELQVTEQVLILIQILINRAI